MKELKPAPSKEAIVQYLLDKPNATQAVIKSFLERTLLVGAGMLILGQKGNLLRNSLASSFAIELYLYLYYRNQLENMDE